MLLRIQKISLFLIGYFMFGIGLLVLGTVLKELHDAAPGAAYGLAFGAILVRIGLWVLGKYEKLGGTKK